jgi:hypothetical protein
MEVASLLAWTAVSIGAPELLRTDETPAAKANAANAANAEAAKPEAANEGGVDAETALMAAGLVERAMGWAAALRARLLGQASQAAKPAPPQEKPAMPGAAPAAAPAAASSIRERLGKASPPLPLAPMAAALGMGEPEDVRAAGGWDEQGRQAERGRLKVPAFQAPATAEDIAAIAGLSDRAVMAQICDDLSRAAVMLGHVFEVLVVQDIACDAARALGLTRASGTGMGRPFKASRDRAPPAPSG